MKTLTPTPAGQLLPNTLCPLSECRAEAVRYSVADHRLTCRACGWSMEVAPVEHADILHSLMFGDDQSAYLLVLASRSCPPAPEPDKVIADRSGDGIKSRVVPAADETPEDRLQRLAEQYALNGGTLRKVSGIIYATSQRRDPETLQPLKEYVVERGFQAWRCSCEASGLCAHIAALWAHCWRLIEDPDVHLNAAQLDRLYETTEEIERQAGLHKTPPVADPVAELFGPVAA